MARTTADVLICGAGIAGIAAAYHLAVKQGVRGVVLVDERPPMSLTSDKSTESYRNWWPGPDDAMVRYMNRSIDLLEAIDTESAHRIRLNRRGYLFVTGDPAYVRTMVESAKAAARLGAGPVRVHAGAPGEPGYVPGNPEDWHDQPVGADLFLDPRLIHRHFPYLSAQTVAVLHARRCGWFSGQQLGAFMLERAKAHGVQFISGRVTGVEVAAGRVQAVHVATAGEQMTIATPAFVAAAGPLIKETGALLGTELPVFSELHLKMALSDKLGVIPRHAPMVIWEDAQPVPWPDDVRAALAEDPSTRHLLAEFPGGAHFRPEGGHDADILLLLWAYHVAPVEPHFPIALDAEFPEIVLRAMTTLAPGLAAYLHKLPKTYVDGGYYTKTRENRPLIGPLPVAGAYLFAALSGFGLMASCAGGELLAAHITGSQLPSYAPAFQLNRYADPAYCRRVDEWGSIGQL